ncbi:MAG: multiheme c-type cytochrome [Acidobacteriota bacterium]
MRFAAAWAVVMPPAVAGALAWAAAPAARPEPPGPPPRAAAPSGGLAGYVGSGTCQACHPAQYDAWVVSQHGRTIHEPSERENALLGRSLLCGEYDAKYVLGERHARRFLVDSETEPGRHLLLPCRYDVGTAEWAHLHESDWTTRTWERECGACHATGFSSDDLTFIEMKVGCEDCHGPGERHGDYKTRADMLSLRKLDPRGEVTICASCHLQGGASRKTGLHFAYNYRAGDDLFADYAFDWKSLDETPQDTANPIDIHQKLLMRRLVTGQEGPGGALRCTSCHTIHANSHKKHEALKTGEYCYLCHEREGFAVKEYEQSCNVCEF